MNEKHLKTNLFLLYFLLTLLSASIFPCTGSAETYRFVRMWPVMTQPWYFFMPFDVAVNGDAYVYVADTNNHRIRKFSSDGHFISEWGSPGYRDSDFNFPHGICVDPVSGNVCVADTKNRRIKIFDSNGRWLRAWGEFGSGEGMFDDPYAITADNSGFIYVADTNNHRIQKFTDTGRFISAWGEYGSSTGQFDKPRGIHAADGFIYVADTGNHRIQKFKADGTFLTAWGNSADDPVQLEMPVGISTDNAGTVYVSDHKDDDPPEIINRIISYTDEGTFISQWGAQRQRRRRT
ncbi:MAG: hypothetical protein V2I97_05035 [Desulfococcaceae bacterium]|jgi:DNA-binding beta-propeller fold protein YncE|nr:hypothetical protein [Desulfococcaceae bacterium]